MAKSPAKKKTTAKKAASTKRKAAAPKKAAVNGNGNSKAPAPKKIKITAFAKKQQQKLLELRDTLMDQMAGVTRENLRNHAEGADSSAFGMHQADAGSDAYDRDFALNLLSKEQDALYEIEEALKRVDEGRYGICEASDKPIGQPRLEAIPFARYTVECQSQLEREQQMGGHRRPMRSVFGLDDGGGDGENNEYSDGDSVDKKKN